MTLLFASGAVPVGLLFWLLMLLSLIFGAWLYWPPAGTPTGWRPLGHSFLIWVLFFLLGLAVFGWPIAGR